MPFLKLSQSLTKAQKVFFYVYDKKCIDQFRTLKMVFKKSYFPKIGRQLTVRMNKGIIDYK